MDEIVQEEYPQERESRSDTYFAALQDVKALGSELMERVGRYYVHLSQTMHVDMLWRRAYRAYFGLDEQGTFHKSSMVTYNGDQSELAMLKVNHLRNIVRHLLVMTTQSRPHLEARAVNNDVDSMREASLAAGILEYYMREMKVEDRMEESVELALVLAEAFVRLGWDSSALEGMGDVSIDIYGPMDVIRDWRRPAHKTDWTITRDFKNKWDLAARYPELKDKILATDLNRQIPGLFDRIGARGSESDDVAVYSFFHKRSDSVPNGRHTIFTEADCVLFDGPLPYKDVPVYRLAPAEFLGSGFGYAGCWDLLSLQQLVDAMVSTIASNFDAHGVQNVVMEEGTDISTEMIAQKLTVWKVPRGGQHPAGVNLTKLPEGWQQFTELLISWMEILSGVNAVTRGEPQSSLKSGAALALVQSQAIQFNSSLQKGYIRLLEDVGTGILNILKEYADAPRIAMIAGADSKMYVRSFSKQDIGRVQRVAVDVGNPMARTIAGKVQLADTMLERGLIKTPAEYFTVFTTGRLDPMYRGDTAETQRIRQENEMLGQGPALVPVTMPDGSQRMVVQGVPAFPIDKHSTHISEHRDVLATYDATSNPDIVRAVMAHIDDHIYHRRTVPPEVLQAIGEEPLQPPGAPPPPAQGKSREAAPSGGQPAEKVMSPPGVNQGEQPGMPNLPKNPMTGQVAQVPAPPGVGTPGESVPGP